MPERTPDGKEWIEDVRARVDALGLTPAKADSLLEEIAQHLEERVADLQRSGASESEARRIALDEVFEDEHLVGEETTGAAAGAPVPSVGGSPVGRAPVEGARTGRPLTGLVRDVRYAVRTLWHQRGYAAAAALALAVGIGGTTVVFGAVDAVLLRPMPFPHADRLFVPVSVNTARGIPQAAVSFADVEDWRNTGLFAEVAVWRQGASDLVGGGDPERVRMAIVSEQFFRLIDVKPAAGRTLLPADHVPGAPQVIVITHSLWQQRFGGAADIIGRRVTLGGDVFEIVGVLRARQVWPEDVALFLPMNTAAFGPGDLTRRDNLIFNALARLPEGVSAERVRARMTEIAARLERDHPRERRGWTNTLVPLREYIVDANTSLALYVLLGAVAGVLLIACANVANLALVRGSGRSRELAVRLSLGASRGRLLQQLLIEGVVLAAVGLAAGVGLAYFLMPGLVVMAPQGTPFLDDVRLNGRVLLAAVVAGGVAAMIAGLVPALSISALQLTGALRDGSAGGGTSRRTTRLRHLLVMAEIAATVVLVTGSALLIRSFDRLTRVNPGVTLDRVVSGRISVPAARYPTQARRLQFADDLVARLEERADIESAALTSFVPAGAGGFGLGRSFLAEGRPDGSELTALWNTVTPHYFQTMGIPIVEGRSFDTRDQPGATPVMIVSKGFAERMFPGEPAIGKRVKSSRDEKVYREIVGIADEVTYWGVGERRRAPLVYVPSAQDDQFGGLIVARSRGDDAGSIVTSVRHALAQVDPGMAIAELRTLEVSANRSIATERYATLLLSILAAVALTLSALGIYGVMRYSFELRRKEMGIRLALGASRGNLYALVFRHGIALTLAGLVFGVAGAVGLTRWLEALLFNTPRADAAAWSMMVVVVLVSAAAACIGPARRVGSESPTTALRAD